MFGDFNRRHGTFRFSATWFARLRLPLDHCKKALKFAQLNFCRTCMNGKHHAFWIMNGVRHWSYRLLASNYAEAESFSPFSSQLSWRNCNLHSTASLQVNMQVLCPRRRINNFSLILTVFFFFFFFFQFQQKAMLAGDEKQKKAHGLMAKKYLWAYLKWNFFIKQRKRRKNKIVSWSKTIQSIWACGPRVLFLPTNQSARPIYSHDNATWKSCRKVERHLLWKPHKKFNVGHICHRNCSLVKSFYTKLYTIMLMATKR